LIKSFPYILFEKCSYILALEMASPGTGTVPVVSAHFRSLWGNAMLWIGVEMSFPTLPEIVAGATS